MTLLPIAGERPSRTLAKTTVAAAVFVALHGTPQAARAQAADSATESLQEVVVTANRRAQTAESVPYSLDVVSADEISRTGVTDMASLARQVPGLSTFDFGARYAAATYPVIRGLNASGSAPLGFRTEEQAPVGTYIGNSPIEGYFQLADVERVEVLRGPQGTLYGAGALGGAIRIIPNAPALGKFSGDVEASSGAVAHATTPSYAVAATLNVPLADTLAFRINGKYAYDPGFISAFGLLARNAAGIPLLANPSDPVNSPGIYTTKKDWNDQKTFTGRASLRWQPVEKVLADLALTYARASGNAGPTSNTAFTGGPSPIDPRIILPSGGDYEEYSGVTQPFSRTSTLTSLDLSYDAGFATLSSTSSYIADRGSLVLDNTAAFAGCPGCQYYHGTPINPRFISYGEHDDDTHVFTEELRLVSNAGADRPIDYVLGVFYEKRTSSTAALYRVPGTPEYSVAEGCTAQGSSFPDCLVIVGPNDTTFAQIGTQRFQDKSIFGELTWHLAPRAQITFGGRHFEQSFTEAQSFLAYTFPPSVPATPRNFPASKNIFKVNPSYEFAQNHYIYATWSQGFRRGGANTLPLTGPFKDSPLLSTYVADTADNYELGLKGRFSNGLSYAMAIFDIEWKNPQISGSLPDGNQAVWNGTKARSKGFELISSGSIVPQALSYNVGFSYADAILTAPYALPANNGTGTIVPGLLSGEAGQQLPGSAKVTWAATLIYDQQLLARFDWSTTLNYTYRSNMPLALLGANFFTYPVSPSYGIANASSSIKYQGWTWTGYVTNLLDKRALILPAIIQPAYTDPTLLADSTINRPREIGLRAQYSF